MRTPLLRFVLVIMALACVPRLAAAQSGASASIAGVVRDATGAVLPGVTVEASSPALIEKSRSVVTDGQGVYRIVDLRPGLYRVTFTLAGFGTVVREGLELTTGVTPTINAELKVGSLEETVTVTGASPVVDTHNVRTQSVISRATLDEIPQSKSLPSLASLTLGATLANPADQDVGGSRGDAGGAGGFTIHGSRANDSTYTIDGMSMSNMTSQDGAASATTFAPNHINTQEITIDTAGGNAEFETAGVHINIVPKDGGNTFSGNFQADGTNSSLQAENLNDDLRQRGLTTLPSIKHTHDVGAAFGGPFAKDKIWFYGSGRFWTSENYVPGVFYQKTLNARFYEADTSRPAYGSNQNKDWGVRLTWQVASKHKVAISDRMQKDCTCFISISTGLQSPEASSNIVSWPANVVQSTWTYPRTSRLLFDAGVTFVYLRQDGTLSAGVTPSDIPITDLANGFTYNANPGANSAAYGQDRERDQRSQRFAMSYITGSHAFKVGVSGRQGNTRENFTPNDTPYGPLSFQFRAGVPVQLTEYATPTEFEYQLRPNVGIFAQDQWTRGKMTLDVGLRADHVQQQSPAEVIGAVPAFGIPVRNFPEATNIPNWWDIAPRLGVAYDLFGNGRTALKGSIGRFVIQQNSTISAANAPANRAGIQATRSWADANGNFVPDCDLTTPLQNGECGRLSNVNLGLPIPSTTYDPEYLEGFDKRGYVWQGLVGLSHELRPGVGLNVSYFNTRYGNFTVTSNRALTPADFIPYRITAPTDPRLGSVSGTQMCGYYDVNPAKFGTVDNFITSASNFGEQSERYNGLEASINARFGAGGLVQGGISTGQTLTDNCAIVRDNPQVPLTINGGAGSRSGDDFCRVVNDWSAQTQVKMAATYPLPWWGIGVSATYQNLPGIPVSANYTVTGAQTSIGRLNAATSIGLLTPFTTFEDRVNQTDVRVTKTFRFARYRIKGQADAYNLFNASSILGVNAAYGANWLRPTAVLPARLFKFGVQVDF